MKSLDDFDDTPHAEDLHVEEFIGECRALAEAEETAFAADTLHGIADTVTRTRTVTDNQRAAVRHIVEGAERSAQGRERGAWSRRRYEGWRR